MRHIFSVLILIMIVALDQISKTYMLVQSIHPIQVNKFLNLVHVWNEGISFGMFSGRYSNIIFTIITGIISLILTYLLLKTSVQIMKIIYILILGGALGNLIDRIKYGAVFDFIDLHIANFHWPAFNVADFSICLGGAILVWNIIFNKKL